jgi:hypothetical protein
VKRSTEFVVNKNDGSMLELSMDEKYIFYYNINNQRRHLNNQTISIPNNYSSLENNGTNINISTIKGYKSKIRKMSYLPKYFYNNNVSLMIRYFNSGHIMNYVLSRNNKIINKKHHRYQLNYKDIGLMNKKINKEYKIHVEEDRCSTYKEKTNLSKIIVRLVNILRDFLKKLFCFVS